MNHLMTEILGLSNVVQVADILIKATVLMVAGLLGLLLLRRSSAASRHSILSLTLTGLLLLPLLTIVVPNWQVAILPPAGVPATTDFWQETHDEADPGLQAVARIAPPDSRQALPSEYALRKELFTGALGTGSGVIWEVVERARDLTWPKALLFVWAVGVFLVLTRMLVGVSRIRWILLQANRPSAYHPVWESLADACAQLGVKRVPELRVSNQVRVPLLGGWFRQVLMLPEEAMEWSPNRLRVVLMHELAHLSRCDALSLVQSRLVTGLYWFHPLVWVIEKWRRALCEQACDDVVLSRGARASEYAAHLLAIARTLPRRDPLANLTLAVARPSRIEARIHAILESSRARTAPSRRVARTTAAVVMLLSVALAALQLTAEPQEKSKTVIPPTMASESFESGPVLTPVSYQSSPVREKRQRVERKSRERKERKSADRERDHFSRGFDLHQSDRFEEAREAFLASIEIGHRPATAMYNIACGYALQNDPDDALDWLQRSLDEGFERTDLFFEDSDLDPIRTDSRFQRMLSQLEATLDEPPTDRFTEASEWMARLQSNPDSTASEWGKLGRRMLGLRRFDEAIYALQSAVDLDGYKATTAMYNLACAFSLRGDTALAIGWLNTAVDNGLDMLSKIESDPDLNAIRASSQFAAIQEKAKLLSLGQFQRWNKEDDATVWAPAIDLYTRYVSTDPSSGRAWFNLGYAYHYSERYPEAIASFQKALELDFRRGTSLYNLACANALMNRTQEAFNWLEQAEANGFTNYQHIVNDSDLESLHEDPRFERYREQALAERHAHREREKKVKREKERRKERN